MNITKKKYHQSQKTSSIVSNLSEAYIFWQNNSKHIPKMLRHSMGIKIDSIFIEIIEITYLAIFTEPEKRINLINKANIKNDLLKFMINVLFELNGIKENIFIEISGKLEEVGRRLYGWKNQLMRQAQNHISQDTNLFEKDKK